MPEPTEFNVDVIESSESSFQQSFVTEHTTVFPDRALSYRAVAEWIPLRKLHKPVGYVFSTAYLATPENVSRPLTFVFNGGPGAASAFLHMGALGPKRVVFGHEGKLPQPPTQVIDNQESWLSFTDLVFIDPIGTGFSRAIQESKTPAKSTEADDKTTNDPQENSEYWEIEKDLDSLGEFISRFLSKHHRWTSPIFIAGESYGGFRVAKMARKLQESHGVGLCGSLLISPAIEFDSLFGTDYNLTHWIELFPSLAAAAHHHRLTRNLPEDIAESDFLQEAEEFARSQLARLLTLGEGLAEEERSTILKRMSELCGLAESVIHRSGGRITATTFCRELLRSQQRLCGHYDASITAVDPYPDRNDYEGPDPTLFSIDRLFTGAINHHLRSNLQVETNLDYRLLSMQVNKAWKDDSTGHVFRKLVGAMDDLRYGMSLNADMKVFISHGYFDLVTPYFSSRRLVDLMKLAPEQKGNISACNYHGGHMFYSWDESRKAFHADTAAFYQSSYPAGENTTD